ncbi:hypothetical protein C355_04756 [Cryptococcus neoformans Th84]|nr:hypothetical protein C355_04756 [Cryptococcus neoformans var. grubii Th84]
MVDLWQKGGRAARGRRVKGRVIWLASLDVFGPSDEWKKKSGDSHSISLSHAPFIILITHPSTPKSTAASLLPPLPPSLRLLSHLPPIPSSPLSHLHPAPTNTH